MMMRHKKDVVVIIPAFNEESSISRVIVEIPRDTVQEIVVVNNASKDSTALVAHAAGATVIDEPGRGYGSACLRGILYASTLDPLPEIIVFLDADYSDSPAEMDLLLQPIRNGEADLVIGSRAAGNREPGSMLPQQVFGNWLATRLIRMLYGVRYSDLGPFRAIRYPALIDLAMTDKTFGWTVEMQVKAARRNIPFTEVPVSYKRRIGVSKITGTIGGTIGAGYKILTTIFKYAIR